MGASTYAFSLVLLAFLLGLGLGSILFGFISGKVKNTLHWIVLISLIIGGWVTITIPLLEQLPLWFLSIYKSAGLSFSLFQLWMFGLFFLLMAIPTISMGMLFPLTASLGKKVGFVYGTNTFGGIIGSILAVILLPSIGLTRGILIFGIIYITVALILTLIRLPSYRWRFLVFICATFFILIGLKSQSTNTALLFSGFYADPDAFTKISKEDILTNLKKSQILFAKDSLSSHVAVTKDSEGYLSLKINGKPDASTSDDMENQILLGHLPMLLNPNSKNALVIGLGSGITLGSVLRYPVENVDVVEIDEVVPQAARFFDQYSGSALSDKRVKLIISDGRHHLLTTNKKYDTISSEPSNPWLSGSSKLFTKEYFELLKQRTRDDGVVIQWINMYAIDVKGLSSIIKSYLDVFPSVVAFGIPISNDIVLLGSQKEIKVDSDYLNQIWNDPKIRSDLERVGISNRFELLARFYLDRRALEHITKDLPPNTDNHPVVEFTAPYYLYQPVKVNPWRVILENISPLSSMISAASSDDQNRLKKSESFRQLRLRARITFVEGDYPAHIKYATDALALDPESTSLKSSLARVYFELGTQYFLKDEDEKAVEYLEKSLEYKDTPSSHLNLAQSYESLGNPTKAQEHYQKAIDLDPIQEIAYLKLAKLKFDTGDLNKALELFEKVIKQNQNNSEAHFYLGQLYLLRGQKEEAKKYLEIAVKLDPENKEIQELLKSL